MGRVASSCHNLVLQIICLLMGAALLGVFTNQIRGDSLPLFQPLPERSVGYIDLNDAHQRLGNLKTVFVDARSSEAYQRRHIDGALSLPIMEVESAYPAISAKLIGKTVIVYCGGPSCTKSERVGQLLLQRGHGSVLVLKAGLSGWSGRGFPTE